VNSEMSCVYSHPSICHHFPGMCRALQHQFRLPSITSAMDTLWGIVSQNLEFHSQSSAWGNKTSVTGLGSQILETPGLLPDRCVHDPNLLDALEAAVKSALEPIYVDEAFIAYYGSLQDVYDRQHRYGVDLSSEEAVRCFLDPTWLSRAAVIVDKFVRVKGIGNAFEFAGGDALKRQQPDVRGQLRPIEGGLVDVSIMELKSEGIVRNFWREILYRGEEDVRLPWDARGRWDVVDKILLKVCVTPT
jgi:hypothetical protein